MLQSKIKRRQDSTPNSIVTCFLFSIILLALASVSASAQLFDSLKIEVLHIKWGSTKSEVKQFLDTKHARYTGDPNSEYYIGVDSADDSMYRAAYHFARNRLYEYYRWYPHLQENEASTIYNNWKVKAIEELGQPQYVYYNKLVWKNESRAVLLHFKRVDYYNMQKEHIMEYQVILDIFNYDFYIAPGR